MKFFLGTHLPHWLRLSEVPLFVSAIRLCRRPQKSKATCDWALDSGGFSELNKSGRWTVGPKQYADETRRWRDELGRMQWAAIQDWMCEEVVLKKTGLTVLEHQMLTIKSWLDLNDEAPEIPWVPVLQGWHHDEYVQHVWLYQKYAGLDLRTCGTVGVGSVCRRHNTAMAEGLIRELAEMGIKVHGFGFKTDGLTRRRPWLASADSLAWSFHARRVWRGAARRCCDGTHKGGCANCRPWAMKWRASVLAKRRIPTLFDLAV